MCAAILKQEEGCNNSHLSLKAQWQTFENDGRLVLF